MLSKDVHTNTYEFPCKYPSWRFNHAVNHIIGIRYRVYGSSTFPRVVLLFLGVNIEPNAKFDKLVIQRFLTTRAVRLKLSFWPDGF